MANKVKRIFALLLAIIMLLLCGCEKQGESNPNGKASSPKGTLAAEFENVHYKGDYKIKARNYMAKYEDKILEIVNRENEHLTAEEIKLAARTEVQFIISSDAHTPARVGECVPGIEKALAAGLDLSRIVNLKVLE